MKILIYSSKFPPLIGGVEEVVKTLSSFLNVKNDVLVLTSLNLNSVASGKLSKIIKGFRVNLFQRYNDIAVNYIFMSLPRTLFGSLSFPLRFILSVFTQRMIIRKYRPNYINAHFLDDNLFYFYFAVFLKKIPIILDIHGNELHVFSKNRFYRFFFQKILRKSKKIVVHSDYMKSELLKRYMVDLPKIAVIPNGVDLKKFKSKNTKPTLDYYLYVGRLDYKKGIDILIKAFMLVEKKVSRKLLIIGGSSGDKKHGSLDIAELKKLASKSTKIEFLGRVENFEVIEYFKNAYYSIFPSRHEPFGIVALESLACGTPFIASSGGFKEIAKNTKAGVIFKEGRIKSLASLILKLDSDSKNRQSLASNAIRNIPVYSLDSIYNKYQRLFE